MKFFTSPYGLFFIGILLITLWFTTSMKQEGFASSGTSSPGSYSFVMYYAPWCPHCKTAKPEWDQVKAEYNGKQIHGYTIIFTEVNCTNESPDVEKMINTYKIEGYPTIKLVKDNQIIDYDAKPSKATLTQFLNTVV